jgi:hypothetical protein
MDNDEYSLNLSPKNNYTPLTNLCFQGERGEIILKPSNVVWELMPIDEYGLISQFDKFYPPSTKKF